MENQEYKLTIKLFFVGLFIIIFAAYLSETLDFVPMWFIGPRELGHLIGFIGMSFMMYFYSVSCFDSKVFKVKFSIHLPIILFSYIFLLFPSLKPSFIPIGAVMLVAILSIYYLVFSFAAFKKIPRVKTQFHFKLMVFISMLFISGYWELIHQPLIDVYGKGPRGYIQWPQVRIDLVGIVIAMLVLSGVLNQSLNKPIQQD
ncbi:hypothetical protein [Pseudocolwellia sp. HL-MZ7]|uniref:hypothetical protein n=1 Tax=Pseudocolwellia sp. HL-MZ7 TaxID=3400627 RepID=UPI003CEA0C4D